LKKKGFKVTLFKTGQEDLFTKTLKQGEHDIAWIISESHLPKFNQKEFIGKN
jgi:hypothetical protein